MTRPSSLNANTYPKGQVAGITRIYRVEGKITVQRGVYAENIEACLKTFVPDRLDTFSNNVRRSFVLARAGSSAATRFAETSRDCFRPLPDDILPV